MPCPHCNAQFPAGAVHCPECGKALPAAGRLQSQASPKRPSVPPQLFESEEQTEKSPARPIHPRTAESGHHTPHRVHKFAETVSDEEDGPDADPLIGQTPLGQYRIVKKIGEGGFGAVYVAEQLGVGRKAVIKVLRQRHGQSEHFIRRFEREAAVLAALDHHHLVRLYNFGELDDGQLFLAMEYGGDKTLAQEVAAHGPLPLERALRIGEQICAALEEAHEHGIVHRDLKPHNILLGEKAGQDWVKVVDVGIAKILDSSEVEKQDASLTASGALVGTPAYFSPEQARGLEVDARSDVYAMGVVLYEMLSGKLPIHGRTPLDFARAHVTDAPRPIRETGVQVPAAVEAILARALEKDPERRFATAGQMAEAIADTRKEVTAAGRRRPRRKPLLFAALAAAGVAAIGLVAILASARSSKPPPPPVVTEVSIQAAPVAPPPVAAPLPAPVAPRPPEAVSPADVDATRLIFEASQATGQPAIDKLEDALDLGPSRGVKSRVYHALAEVHERAGHRGEALKYYQLYLPHCSPEEKQPLQEKIARLSSAR